MYPVFNEDTFMIITHFLSGPDYSEIPTEYTMIGEATYHYSTGTRFAHIYSNSIKEDLEEMFTHSNFKPRCKYAPTLKINGIEFDFMKGDKYKDFVFIFLRKTNGVEPPAFRCQISIDKLRECQRAVIDKL